MGPGQSNSITSSALSIISTNKSDKGQPHGRGVIVGHSSVGISAYRTAKLLPSIHPMGADGVPMGCCTNSCLQPLHSNHEKSLFCFVLFVSPPLPFAQITHQLTN